MLLLLLLLLQLLPPSVCVWVYRTFFELVGCVMMSHVYYSTFSVFIKFVYVPTAKH